MGTKKSLCWAGGQCGLWSCCLLRSMVITFFSDLVCKTSNVAVRMYNDIDLNCLILHHGFSGPQRGKMSWIDEPTVVKTRMQQNFKQVLLSVFSVLWLIPSLLSNKGLIKIYWYIKQILIHSFIPFHRHGWSFTHKDSLYSSH